MPEKVAQEHVGVARRVPRGVFAAGVVEVAGSIPRFVSFPGAALNFFDVLDEGVQLSPLPLRQRVLEGKLRASLARLSMLVGGDQSRRSG